MAQNASRVRGSGGCTDAVPADPRRPLKSEEGNMRIIDVEIPLNVYKVQMLLGIHIRLERVVVRPFCRATL